MLRSVGSKVAWVGRATVFLVGLAVILALVFGVATTAMGANGNPFLLGKSNVATALSKLTGNVNGSAMQVVNSNAGANDTALDLRVQAGEAPMRVNTAKKVANLNADRIDDREASSFANATHAHAGEDITSGTVEADRIEDGSGSNLNADKLDGKDSNELVRSGLGSDDGLSTSLSLTSRTSVTVNAPSNGFVITNGTILARTSSTSSSSCNPCEAHMDIFNSTTQQKSSSMPITIGNGTAQTLMVAIPATWVFPVEAGDNTIHLRGAVHPANSAVSLYNPTLSAVYVPYDESGAPPSPVEGT